MTIPLFASHISRWKIYGNIYGKYMKNIWKYVFVWNFGIGFP